MLSSESRIRNRMAQKVATFFRVNCHAIIPTVRDSVSLSLSVMYVCTKHRERESDYFYCIKICLLSPTFTTSLIETSRGINVVCAFAFQPIVQSTRDSPVTRLRFASQSITKEELPAALT
jgi:hypothetical protein